MCLYRKHSNRQWMRESLSKDFWRHLFPSACTCSMRRSLNVTAIFDIVSQDVFRKISCIFLYWRCRCHRNCGRRRSRHRHRLRYLFIAFEIPLMCSSCPSFAREGRFHLWLGVQICCWQVFASVVSGDDAMIGYLEAVAVAYLLLLSFNAWVSILQFGFGC